MKVPATNATGILLFLATKIPLEFSDDLPFAHRDESCERVLRYVFADEPHRTICHGKLTTTCVETMESVASNIGTHCTRSAVGGPVVKRTLQPMFEM